jgi:Leucine-rich repeat (LRR) protein
MFRLRISLKWFLLGTVAAAMLIALAKRQYDDWQRRLWLAAPAVAGKQQEFNDGQYRRWLEKQKSIRDAVAVAGARFSNREVYLVSVDVLPNTDRRCLAALADATALEEFGSRVPLRDVDLLWLKNHPGLKRLPGITGRGVTNHTLAAIGTCHKLEYLSIESSSITDEGLVHLAGLDRLDHLGLNNNAVTGRGFAPLARLPRLSFLSLSGCPVNDEGLREIGQLTHLESLNLTATKIDGSGLSHLASLPKLRTLWLNQTAILDGAGFAELDAVRSLELVANSQLRPGILKNVAQMKSLEHLIVANSSVTDDLLSELSGAQQLRELNLAHTLVSDEGLVHLENLTGLRELVLNLTSVSEAGARRLSQALPRTKIHSTGGSIGPSE